MVGKLSHNRYKLFEEIIARSEAKNWDDAKLEWALADITIIEPEDPAETCLCGHHPIREVCTLVNEVNANTAIVGNVCVYKFIGLHSKPIVAGLKRVQADRDAALNEAALNFALAKGWITERDYRFGMDTRRKRKFSDAQLKWRRDINRRVLKRSGLD